MSEDTVNKTVGEDVPDTISVDAYLDLKEKLDKVAKMLAVATINSVGLLHKTNAYLSEIYYLTQGASASSDGNVTSMLTKAMEFTHEVGDMDATIELVDRLGEEVGIRFHDLITDGAELKGIMESTKTLKRYYGSGNGVERNGGTFRDAVETLFSNASGDKARDEAANNRLATMFRDARRLPANKRIQRVAEEIDGSSSASRSVAAAAMMAIQIGSMFQKLREMDNAMEAPPNSAEEISKAGAQGDEVYHRVRKTLQEAGSEAEVIPLGDLGGAVKIESPEDLKRVLEALTGVLPGSRGDSSDDDDDGGELLH